MRVFTTIATILFLTVVTSAQATSDANRQAKVKEELQKLFADLNEAIVKKDRAKLERVYADEFQFIHGNGYVVTKTAQIDGIMANTPLSSTPVPVPSFDPLLLYGDVAVFRDTVRNVAGTNIYVKKNGQWQIFQVQGTRLAPQRNAVKIDPQLLDSFLGRYEFGPGAVATVTREGDVLKWRGGNRLPAELVPLSDTRFFGKENDSEMTFTKNDNGQVTDVVLKLGVCQESRAKKIE
jgi:hypothetical protein